MSTPQTPERAPWPFPHTAAGNGQLLVHLFGADLAHVPGVGWHVWHEDGAAWHPDHGAELGALAYAAIGAMRSFAETYARDEEAPKLLRHAQVSDDLAPYQAMIRAAAKDERISRDPATFDPEHRAPVEIDRDWPIIEHARQTFYPSRYAAKLLRKGNVFARTGSPYDLRSKLWILEDDEYVRCDGRWFAKHGPLELGGEWRALYGTLTIGWLKALSPQLADVRASATPETANA